jgi:hypothetical protein
MRLQFASDLHLNSWLATSEKTDISFETILKPVAKTLILCGDIGSPDSTMLQIFFKWCSKRWDKIFWIPGHHEMMDVWHHRTRTYDECINHMRVCIADYTNIHVLHREMLVTEDGYLLLACPLWGHLSSMSESMFKDPLYKEITHEHQKDLAWLREQLKKVEMPVIVATHYPPSMRLMNRELLHIPHSTLYVPEMEGLLRSPIVAWICGYLHEAVQVHRPYYDATGNPGEVLIVTNPRGYPDDGVTGYRNDAVLRLENI